MINYNLNLHDFRLLAIIGVDLTELERYLFDLQGLIVLENALTPAEIAAINALLDLQIARIDRPGKEWVRFDSLLSWDVPFRNLIDNPRITP